MKTESEKKPEIKKADTKIETDGPLSEKDEVKKAEDKMRKAQQDPKSK